MDDDTYIPCIIIRDGKVHRHFLNADGIVDLDQVQTSVGGLRMIHKVGNQKMGCYYKAWIRSTNARWCTDTSDFNNRRSISRLYNAIIMNCIIQPHIYPEAVIVSFTDKTFRIPKFMDYNDHMLKLLSRWYTASMRNWAESYREDDLAPKK